MNKSFTANGKLLKVKGGFASFDPDAFEWYTLTESDCTYLAQSGYNRTIIQSIITEEPNIIIPSTLANYPVYFDINIPSSVKRIKFEDTGYNTVSIKASNNSTLLGIYNAPERIYQLNLGSCSALKFVELDKVKSVSSTHQISGCSALESLSEVNENYTGSSLYKLWYMNKSGNVSRFHIPDNVINFEFGLYDNGITEFTIDESWEHLTTFGNALINNPIGVLTFDTDNATLDSAWTGGANTIGGGTWFDFVSTDKTGDILHYSAYNMGAVSIQCNYDSAIYRKLRYAQASQNYMMRNLRLHLMDGHPIKQISFWGDSLTRRNESTSVQSNLVEHFYNWMADDVWCWNEGHGGATTTSYVRDYSSQQARWRDDAHVIWLGTNDTILTEAQTIANIQTMINTMGISGKCIVLQPFGWGYSSGNEALYNQAFPGITINTHKYIIDHGFEVLGREPTAEEQEQLDNNVIPDVFVDTSDMTHITDSGGLVIATAVKEKLLSTGIIDNTWFASN